MSLSGKHGLVFGASGISGWSLLNQCLSYPTNSSFRRITGLCNRPLTKKDARLPDDPRLSVIPGVDLTQSVESIKDQLKAKVEDVDGVDVVFFCAYIETSDFQSLREVNSKILRTAIEAISALAVNLQTVILQTGGKGYGVQFTDQIKLQPPLRESLPRIPEPWRSKVFYYDQYDVLQELSRRQKWTFAEIRPDVIVGFVSGSNVMNLAYGIAFYLSLYRQIHGKGATVPFPGRLHGYHSTHTDTFQDILSKMEIYTALNHDRWSNGSAFNIADGEKVSWAQVWPGICSYFGLVGVEPESDQKKIGDFVRENQSTWNALADANRLRKESVDAYNWSFAEFTLVEFDFDREYALDAARSVGFTESIDTVQGYLATFDRMVGAKLIPSFV